MKETLADLPKHIVAQAENLRWWLVSLLMKKGYSLPDAEDLVSEALFRFYMSSNIEDGKSSLATKLRLCVNHRILDDWRKHKLDSVALDAIDEALTACEIPSIYTDLHIALEKLKPDVSKLILLHVLGGLTVIQLGEKFGVPGPTVYKRIQTGLRQLRRLLV